MRFLKRTFSRKEIVRVAAPIAVLALLASVVAGRERAEPALEPAARMDARVRPAEQDLDLAQLFRPAQAEAEQHAVDPFARRSFAPKLEAAREAPQAPTAPPLPFRYVGKMIEDGELQVFLARGEESYSLRAGQKKGQKVDEQYRVDKVTENRVTFTYLPLKTQQTLEIPAVN
jgi:Tfp pilus assembly protein PilP